MSETETKKFCFVFAVEVVICFSVNERLLELFITFISMLWLELSAQKLPGGLAYPYQCSKKVPVSRLHAIASADEHISVTEISMQELRNSR